MNKAKKIKVITVDDYRLSRAFFEMLIAGDSAFTLAGSFSSADEALEFCRRNKVDLVIMDILMRSGSDGLTVAGKIKALSPDTKIILATSATESLWEDKAKAIGIESFWYKEYSEEPLLEVIRRTLAGESVYPDEDIDIPFGKAKRTDLTPRDLDVLRELMRGMTNDEIAARLGISVNTVRTHVQNMLNKTGFKSRLEMVVNAAALGIAVNNDQNLPKKG